MKRKQYQKRCKVCGSFFSSYDDFLLHETRSHPELIKTKRKQRRFTIIRINENELKIKPNKLHMALIPIIATGGVWCVLINGYFNGLDTELIIFAAILSLCFLTVPLLFFLLSPDTIKINTKEQILEKTTIKGLSIKRYKIPFKRIKKIISTSSCYDLERTGGEIDPLYSVYAELDNLERIVLFQDSNYSATSEFHILIEGLLNMKE